jgi:AcrR family transcriptional regulator
MARRPSTKPRKLASQERSRATVDALVDATARILVKEGFDKASTNRIAEVAGVSVGSLYQYFPSKEALVAAVATRHQQEVMQTVRGELADVFDQPLAKAMHKLVTVAVKAHRVDPKLHRVLAEQIPRVGELEKPSIARTTPYSEPTSRGTKTSFASMIWISPHSFASRRLRR